jgi:hydrogenase maturation protease
MSGSVLIAGIGNIFCGDDAFGVAVVQKLVATGFPEHLRIMDVGIRGIDLAFALLDGYDLTILVDATARGAAPGTLYTIEIDPADIPDSSNLGCLMNAHGLDPVRVLALAKSMGARFKRVMLVGCEPLTIDCDESGHFALSEAVGAAVSPAVEKICQIIEKFAESGKEVCFHECA